MLESNNEIALIEKPEYKRRWNTEAWEEREQRALKNWLLDRLETPKYRKGTKDHPEFTTTAQMAEVASADAEFQQVAALYRGRPDFDMAALVAELVEAECKARSQVIELETLPNTLLTLPPTVRIDAMAATAIREAISVYSIAVAPCSFFINLRKIDSIRISNLPRNPAAPEGGPPIPRPIRRR